MGKKAERTGYPSPVAAAALLALFLLFPGWAASMDTELDVGSLRHESTKVRTAAAMALGKAGDLGAVDPLVDALGDPQDEVRNAAAAALKELGEPLGELIHTSLTATGKEAEELARIARQELANGKDPRAVDAVARALGAWNTYVRIAAARTLTVLGDPRAVDPLIKALGSPEKPARAAAARALRTLADERAIDPLIKALDDSHEPVRADAAATLGRIGDARAVQPLVRALADWHVEVRRGALLSLGALSAFKGAGAVDAMVRALVDPNAGVREAAVRALESYGDPRAFDPLIKVLWDAEPRVREAAVQALAKSGDPRAVDPLVLALGDDNVAVRNAGTRALDGFGEPLGRQIYAAIEGVRGARKELAAKKDPRVVAPLIRCLRNPDDSIRRNAASLLGSIGDRRAVDGLVEMAGGWNVPDRVVALWALLRIDQELFPGLLTAVLRVAVRPASLVFLLFIVGIAALFVHGRRRLRR